MVKGRPCEIFEVSISDDEVKLVSLDIINGRMEEEKFPSSQEMEVPDVKQQDYIVVQCFPEQRMSLMDDDGNIREEVKVVIDDALAAEIEEKCKETFLDDGTDIVCTIMSACGEEKVIACQAKPAK